MTTEELWNYRKLKEKLDSLERFRENQYYPYRSPSFSKIGSSPLSPGDPTAEAIRRIDERSGMIDDEIKKLRRRIDHIVDWVKAIDDPEISAIANRLLNHGTAVICMTMIDMLARIRDTYRRQSGASEANVVGIYEDVPLLIIDDLGKEAPTDWGIQMIFEIINARYERMLPIVITTNYDFDRLTERMVPRGSNDSITAEALVDRLREMCGPVLLTGESWRRRG